MGTENGGTCVGISLGVLCVTTSWVAEKLELATCQVCVYGVVESIWPGVVAWGIDGMPGG